MAELCSNMPTSGGLYNADAVLAPKSLKALVSWLIGWSNWLSQITWAHSINYSLANLIYSLALMNNPSLSFQSWHVYLLCLALMTVHAILSFLPKKQIAWINSFGSVLNMFVVLIIFITLLAGNKRTQPKWNSNYQVW